MKERHMRQRDGRDVAEAEARQKQRQRHDNGRGEAMAEASQWQRHRNGRGRGREAWLVEQWRTCNGMACLHILCTATQTGISGL
jgi:hypothetical protein